MKNTKVNKARNQTTKPDAAPEAMTAVVFFKTGATMQLQFVKQGGSGRDELTKFVDDYLLWATNAPSKKPGNCYEVCSWGADQQPPEHQQSVIIIWDAVQVVNYST